MSNRCQFIVGGQGVGSDTRKALNDSGAGRCHGHESEPGYDFCDAPASIKRDGIWLCAEHYDHCEENAVNYVGSISGRRQRP